MDTNWPESVFDRRSFPSSTTMLRYENLVRALSLIPRCYYRRRSISLKGNKTLVLWPCLAKDWIKGINIFCAEHKTLKTSVRLSAQRDEEFKRNLHPYLRVPPKLFRHFCWSSFRFVNAMVYYGVSFSTPTLGGNMYLNFFLASIIEIPANYVSIWAMGK